jgi:hypothetical protein
MEFKIGRTCDDTSKPCEQAYQKGKYWYIEIKTLEELLQFQEIIEEDLIIFFRKKAEIEIYDEYRE